MPLLLIWKAAEINPQTLLGIWPYGNIWILYDGLVFWNICRSLASWAFYILLLIFFTTALKSKQTHLRDKVEAAERAQWVKVFAVHARRPALDPSKSCERLSVALQCM